MKKFKVSLWIKRTIYILFFVELFILIVSFFINIDQDKLSEDSSLPSDFSLLSVDDSRSYQKIEMENVVNVSSLIFNEKYNKYVYSFEENDILEFKVSIEKTGKYHISFDYLSLAKNVEKNTFDLVVNNNLTDDNRNIELTTPWKNISDEEIYDIYRNQVSPMQENANIWCSSFLFDQQYLKSMPLTLELKAGENTFKISKNTGKFLLGDIYFYDEKNFDTYENYQNKLPNIDLENQELVIIEGESPLLKSNPEIQMESVNNTSMTPYSTSKNKLNTLSGNSFNQSGDKVTYGFNVPNEGLYQISIKYLISLSNTNVNSKIYLDNKILFENLNGYTFKSLSNKYQNTTLNIEGENIQFYLTKGFHTLGIQLDASKQSFVYNGLNSLISDMNDLALEVIKLTNGNVDSNRVWDLDKYLPTAKTRMLDFENRIKILMDYTEENSKSDPNKQSRLYQQLENAYGKMKKLNKNPNKLPNQLSLFNEGSTSVGKMLSESLQYSTYIPLSIDKIYIHSSDTKLPKSTSNFLKANIAFFKKIANSGVDKNEDDDEIKIWVNRSTYYVSLMQQFADAYYTKNTGKKIRFSLLPDESKIIYANASNTQPDAAFGVSSSVPYDLGIRKALVDLKKLDGFSNTISKFTPGSLTNKIVEDQVYGIPETQDFQVMFYRTDLIEDLGITIPNTYEELIEILPSLQRYGMNFYFPLAGGTGLKSLSNTAPFIYQHGGNIYSKDYMTANIDSKEAIEAINLMVDLFAIYSLPLTAQNFYQSFRDGRIPIGIAGLDFYLQIYLGAPEILGKWEITLIPGVQKEDGTIDRTSTSAGREIVVFNKSDKVADTWDFIKWWMSSDIQSSFASAIQQTYGESFLWNTANLESFETLSLPKHHKDIILEQWESLYQIPQMPATYILERGISDIWNKAVFNQEPVRGLITDMTIEMNNEIKRKMKEFKYLDKNYQIIKPYYVASIEDIKSWMKEKENES